MASCAIACSNSGTMVSLGAPADAGRDRSVVAPRAGLPFLTRLGVSTLPNGDASAPSELVPPFSPSVYDYYVRCAAGTNVLTVTMTASPGSSSLLLQPTLSPSLAAQDISLNVDENQAIVAAATDTTASTEYWVRCLPHDFPALRMTAHPEAGAPPPGYYVLGNLQTEPGVMGYAMVLDGHGVPVWYFRQPDGLGVCDVDSPASGAISFIPTAPRSADVSALAFETHRLSPLLTTYAAPSGAALDLHELRVLSTGHDLVLADPVKSGVDLSGLHPTLDWLRGPSGYGPDSNISDCEIVEFDPATGAVAWEWFASDHFAPAQDSTFPETAAGLFGPGNTPVIDTFHCNAIDVDPVSGNLLVSARNMDSIFYIERSTGTVLWKMGGSVASKDNATYVSVADAFYRQHDARLQPGWTGARGQISLFDDETAKAGPARAVVYDVVVGDGNGGATGDGAGWAEVATVAWQHEGSSTVDAQGSFRILADGSRVIGWGAGTDTPFLVFTEVDVAGRDLLDFEFLDGTTAYRVVKVPLDKFDRNVLRSTAGLAVSRPPSAH